MPCDPKSSISCPTIFGIGTAGAALRDAGIAYVPDYVVNAGGMMGASQVIYSEPSRDEALKKIESLKSTIQDILKIAMRDNRPTSDVANAMALQRIEGA